MSIEGNPNATLLNFQGLLNRLGVRGVATLDFVPHIVPVAIVDGQVSAIATSGPPLDVPFTAGELAAPAANTRLADTGALVAGQYNITWILGVVQDTNTYRLRRRNGADNADVWSQRIVVPGNTWAAPATLRMVMAASERFVIECVGAGVVNSVYQASVWVQGPF